MQEVKTKIQATLGKSKYFGANVGGFLRAIFPVPVRSSFGRIRLGNLSGI
ncbi:hypothetical protein [Aquimarina spongiae]|nr:hypothetical protein [Aquimarina spongiae]